MWYSLTYTHTYNSKELGDMLALDLIVMPKSLPYTSLMLLVLLIAQ
jgi:hypothetical protein